MDFNLVVMLPTRRLRVPLEMSTLSNHQCKNKLKLFFLFYSEAAKAVAKTAVMVNTVGPWCPKLGFLAKLTEDLCPSRFIDCHEQLSETRWKFWLGVVLQRPTCAWSCSAVCAEPTTLTHKLCNTTRFRSPERESQDRPDRPIKTGLESQSLTEIWR